MSPDADIPPMPSWSNFKVFIWGAVWSAAIALAPVVVLVTGWWQAGQPIDWALIQRTAAVSCVAGLVAYGRKHKALLSPPPAAPAEKPQS
jgi:hypothetical protein